MTNTVKNIIIIILSVLALTGLIYGVCVSDNVKYAKELQELDERIMELQYQIDKAQDEYSSCETILSNAHSSAETYRAEINELQKKKAELVGLEME